MERTRVEIWQCDANGRYHHPPDRAGGRDARFQGFMWMIFGMSSFSILGLTSFFVRKRLESNSIMSLLQRPEREPTSKPPCMAWRYACLEESTNPKNPMRLPLLFEIDEKLRIANGNTYPMKEEFNSAGTSASCGGIACGGSAFGGAACCGDGGGSAGGYGGGDWKRHTIFT